MTPSTPATPTNTDIHQLSNSLGGYLQTARLAQSKPTSLFDKAFSMLSIKEETLFVFTSDWHLGAMGTDYIQFENDIGVLYAAKALFGDRIQIIAMGDYIDGYLSQGTPQNNTQILSPKDQREAAKEALRLIKPFIVLEADHDMWHSRQEIQYDWLHEFALEENVNFAQWGTELHIQVPDLVEPLKWLIRHRAKGSKNGADSLKPQKNVYEELGPAQLVALGHFHSFPGVYRANAKRRHEGTYWGVQTGTYKLLDEYGKKLGYNSADYGVPAVLLKTDGTIIPFDDFKIGIDTLL